MKKRLIRDILRLLKSNRDLEIVVKKNQLEICNVIMLMRIKSDILAYANNDPVFMENYGIFK